MQTLKSIEQIIEDIKYRDWKFRILIKDDGFLIQAKFVDEDAQTETVQTQYSRKWYVSQHACTSEVIRTAFFAVREASEHQLCERFKFKGQAIFSPHLDLQYMCIFIENENPFETRNNPQPYSKTN